MNNDKIKHIELMQNVISRMANNSFLLKGWAITLLSGLLLFGSTSDLGYLLLIPIIPTLSFWGLDSYYLRQERLFRKLYEHYINSYNANEPNLLPFSMDTSPYKDKVGSWLETVFSPTELWFYFPVYFVVIGINLITNLLK
jgi:hypothetical protein